MMNPKKTSGSQVSANPGSSLMKLDTASSTRPPIGRRAPDLKG
jgi:hypothetical protein